MLHFSEERRMKRAVLMRSSAVMAVLLALAALPALVGCGGGPATVQDGRLLLMGNENIAFLEIANGEPGGFSAELVTEMAGRMGLELEVTLEPFAALFASLEAGECDIAMSAITITPERMEQVDFSDPYFDSGQAILVPEDSAVSGEADLAGKRVGVLEGSTNQETAESIPGIAEIVRFREKPPMFEALVAGGLDAVISDTPFAQFNAKATGKTKIAKVLTRSEKYGIAVKKGNSELLRELNDELRKLKEDGTYDRLYEKYFGDRV